MCCSFNPYNTLFFRKIIVHVFNYSDFEINVYFIKIIDFERKWKPISDEKVNEEMMFDSSCLVKISSRHENGFKISNSQFLYLQISIISEHKFSFPQETNLALFGWFACRISRDCAESAKKDLKV